MRDQLVLVSGPEEGRRFILAEGQPLLIGNGRESDTCIDDPHMSPVHCSATLEGRYVKLVPTGGSIVGDTVTGESQLQPGDSFQIGLTRIQYQVWSPAVIPQRKERIRPLHDLVGERLAQYQLQEIVARGNTGMVFKSTDTVSDDTVIVKVLTPDGRESAEAREQYVRAINALRPIRHPHLVRVYRAGVDGIYCWAAVEFVEGDNLQGFIDRQAETRCIDWRVAYRMTVQIAKALREVHNRKIVHRNMTPANVLYRATTDSWVLSDAMLATAMEGTLARQVTQAGPLSSDSAFHSPEQMRAEGIVDQRSDIYGLGAVCYALLTGRPPFSSDASAELVRLIRDAEPVNPRTVDPAINEQLEGVVLKMLAKNADDRYPTASALLEALGHIASTHELDEHLEIYLQDSTHLLDEVSHAMEQLRGGGDRDENLRDAVRLTRTLNADAEVMDLQKIVFVTHRLVRLFDRLRSESQQLDQPILDPLQHGLDFVRTSVERLRAGEEVSTPDQQLLEDLRSLVGSDA